MTHTAYSIHGAQRSSRWVLTCDHAANTVPNFVNNGDLGLAVEDMNRHIAYDVGAAGVTKALADALDAPAILSNFSRLVIDPNRGEDDPTLLMKLYDGTIIPANRHAGPQELETRLNALYRPYHIALAELASRRDDTVILSMHSFTKQFKGRAPRPWQIAILYAADARLSAPLIQRLQQEADLCVGDNEPYNGDLPGDSIARHALAHNRPNALIELRNDLIETPEDQIAWSKRLAPILTETLAQTGL